MSPAGIRAVLEPLRMPLQIVGTYLVGWGIPFAIFAVSYRLGYDISTLTYILAVIAMLNADAEIKVPLQFVNMKRD